jgi:membrane protease subunit HflC
MKKIIAAIIIVGILILLSQGLFIIREDQQAVITRFGKPMNTIKEAGINFRIPFIDQINIFEKRILKWDGDPNQITTQEKKYIWADATARWRIIDPLKFMKTVATQHGAHSRLDDIVDSVVRDAVSGNYLVNLVRGPDYKEVGKSTRIEQEIVGIDERITREDVLQDILEKARLNTPDYGIDLIDVQIKRLNYVEQVRERVYERMISERNKVAAEYRSEGEGKKAEILGQMDKELKKINSEAKRTSLEVKGNADATAAKIYAEAYGKNPEFYYFYRTLESLEKSVGDNNKLVISADSEMYKYLKNANMK